MDKKMAADFAKTLTVLCVRNDTPLEDLHAGYFPTTKTGNYSDVKVIDGEGREIPWNELSRLDDEEMKKFMKEIVNNIYTFFMLMKHPNFVQFIGHLGEEKSKWDTPEMKESWQKLIDTPGYLKFGL